MPISDGEDLNYPILYYLIKLSLFAGAFFVFLIWLFQPIVIENPGVAAYQPPPGTRLVPLPRKIDSAELTPTISCCGHSDAYYADKVVTRNGKNYAVITDARDDAPLQRPHVAIGTEILIPDHKYKLSDGNPTGHRVIFLSNPDDDGNRDVYCFVDGTGT